MNIEIFPLKGDKQQIIPRLIDKFGIPNVRKDLAVYYKKQSDISVHLRFRNKKCLALVIDPKTDEILRPKIHIDTDRTNIKSLILFLKKLGYNEATFGLATCYGFYNQDATFVELMTDTFIGDFIQVGYEGDSIGAEITAWLKSQGIEKLDKNELKIRTNQVGINYEEVINDLDVLNPKIYHYAQEIKLDIVMPNRNLITYLQHFNNDYSYLEKAFHDIFQCNFLATTGIDTSYAKYFSPVSIIIPCFNSGESFIKTLLSINSQVLPQNCFAKIEAILVDDGSEITVKTVLDKIHLGLKYKYRIIRIETNSGLANARNTGLSLAKNDNIIFLDSDVVLSNNYLLEHSLRNLLVPNAVFVSFKQNLNPDDSVLDANNINLGLKPPDVTGDLRVKKIINDESLGLYEISGKIAVEILSSTNYFKDLSYGRNMGIYDLPCMVIGHNMSCRKSNIQAVGGFSNNFTGWGMEDSYFGAKLIAQGNFIIPVLSCGVYHIDHPPRSGSEEKKHKELEKNLQKYKQLLNSEYSPLLVR